MNKPRYAIAKVDINCPKDVCGEEDFCFLSKGKTLADMCDHCEFLQEKRIIGDTKEQLIKKVAQKIFIKRNSFGGKNMNKIWTETDRIYAYKLAKEIVEFLGVEK